MWLYTVDVEVRSWRDGCCVQSEKNRHRVKVDSIFHFLNPNMDALNSSGAGD